MRSFEEYQTKFLDAYEKKSEDEIYEEAQACLTHGQKYLQNLKQTHESPYWNSCFVFIIQELRAQII